MKSHIKVAITNNRRNGITPIYINVPSGNTVDAIAAAKIALFKSDVPEGAINAEVIESYWLHTRGEIIEVISAGGLHFKVPRRINRAGPDPLIASMRNAIEADSKNLPADKKGVTVLIIQDDLVTVVSCGHAVTLAELQDHVIASYAMRECTPGTTLLPEQIRAAWDNRGDVHFMVMPLAHHIAEGDNLAECLYSYRDMMG